MLKTSLHVHIKGDHDYIPYTGFDLLDRAHELGFEVIAFTGHQRVIYDQAFKKHAQKLGILLIPGIELNLTGHVLVLNAGYDAENIKTLDDLRAYREKHPEIFTIAAHPFFPRNSVCLQKRLRENLDLFDAIEHSWFYSKAIDWNKKAKKLTKEKNLPYISTSDIHLLEMLENGHVLIDAEKNIESIFEALRNKRFKSIAKEQGVFKIWWTFAKMMWQGFRQYFPWTPPLTLYKHPTKDETISSNNQRESKTLSKKDRVSGRI